MRALKEMGIGKISRYFFYSVIVVIMNAMFPPIRAGILKLFGARVGRNSVVENVEFIDFHYHGFKTLKIGKKCIVAKQAMLDIAAPIVLEDEAVIGPRAIILTHTNIGYRDHPLKKKYPATAKPVTLKRGCYVAAGAIVLPGITVGEGAVVAAGSVVTKDVKKGTVVGGVPAKPIKNV